MPDYQRGKIYVITNTKNDTVYFGSSAQRLLSMRWSAHRSASLVQESPLYIAMREIGRDKFHIHLHQLFPCQSKDELEAAEWKAIEDAIAKGQKVYNTDIHGVRSPDTIRKIANTKIGKPRDAVTKDKLSKALKGKFKNDESPHWTFGSIYLKPGTAREAPRWMFQYTLNGKRCSKSANVDKLGFWEAKRIVDEKRKEVFPSFVSEEEKEFMNFLSIEV